MSFFFQFFETETKTYGPDLYGQNYTMLCKTSLRVNPYYAQYYIFWCKVIFMELIPYITIISLNTWIVLDIFKSYKFREEHCRQKASELVRPQQKGMYVSISDIYICLFIFVKMFVLG